MSIEIKTFLFCNIGVTGLWDEDYTLSRNKLCIIPVSRQELFSGNVNLRDANIRRFQFNPIDDDYEEGKPLIEYDLVFEEDECQSLIDYLESFEKPCALVSYCCYIKNYPILRAALGHFGRSMPKDLRCIDLAQAFYEIENNFGPQNPRDSRMAPWNFRSNYNFDIKYTINDVYERITRQRYDLTQDRPIRQSEWERGIVVPHIKMWIRCCIAPTMLPQLQNWLDRSSSSTVFNEGTLLPHELRRRQS